MLAALCTITSTEYNALYSLYNATQGREWKYRTIKWNFNHDYAAPCLEWEGVICEHLSLTKCAVSELSLSDMNLNGTIPSDFTTFSHLLSFDFKLNHLHGTLPVSWTSFSTLHTIRLQRNSFSGTLPPSWSSFRTLGELNISHNAISGTLPLVWSQWTSLNKTDLSRNNITGTLPEEWSNMHSLSILDMTRNQITGTLPIRWSTMKLETIVFDSNFLTGGIPNEWSSMSRLSRIVIENNLLQSIPDNITHSLKEIWLSHNNIFGTIPEKWKWNSKLLLLNLPFNHLNGTLPESWSIMTQLTGFSVWSNSITGVLPLQWSRWSSMKYLSLSHNSFSGTIPSCWSAMINLTLVDMRDCTLKGSLPWQWSSMTRLKNVYVHTNFLTNTFPTAWTHIKTLEYLDIRHNSISGTLPNILLTQLRVMYLSDNLLTGGLAYASNATCILNGCNIGHNFFEGPVPPMWSLCPSVSYVNLEYNMFTGTLPPLSAINSQNLGIFEVNSNYLEGDLSDFFYFGTHVENINISGNSFYGSLQLPRIVRFLAIGANYFTGISPLPNSVQYVDLNSNFITTVDRNHSDINKLEFLDLSKNQIIGRINEFPLFNHTKSLTDILLSENCFSGSIPTIICSFSRLQYLILNNLALGSKCSRKITFLTNSQITGSIPSCLFQIPTIDTIDLMGNMLHGTLPDIEISPQLKSLVLMSNYLTGSIPLSMQSHPNWFQLILSSNQFYGTLSQSFTLTSNATSLNMSSNRLSGNVPDSFSSLTSIDVLSGNVFSCDSSPSNDVSYSHYSCGSLNLSYVYYLYLFVVIALLILALSRSSRDLLNDFAVTTSKIHLDAKLIRFCRRACLLLACLYIIRVVVYYQHESSRQFEFIYGWLSTTVYMQGETAVFVIVVQSVMMLLLWKSFQNPFYYIFPSFQAHFDMSIDNPDFGVQNNPMVDANCDDERTISRVRSNAHYSWRTFDRFDSLSVSKSIANAGESKLLASLAQLSSAKDDAEARTIINTITNSDNEKYTSGSSINNTNSNNLDIASKPKTPLSLYLRSFAYLMGSFTMVSGLTVFYIIVVLEQLDQKLQTLVQICLAAYKLFWNQLYSKLVVTSLVAHNANFEVVFVNVLLADLFTFIVSPLIVILATDVSCFRYAIISLPSVVITYMSQQPTCIIIPSDAVPTLCADLSGKVERQETIEPPWLYSYQCSSSIITSYIPVTFYSYLIMLVILPFIQISIYLMSSKNRIALLKKHWWLGYFLDHSFVMHIDSKSSVMQSTTHLHSIMIRHIVSLLFFGTASPILGVIIMSTTLVEDASRQLGLFAAYTDNKALELIPLDMTLSDYKYSAIIHNIPNIYTKYLPICFLIVSAYWSVFVFDAIADIYDNKTGFIASIIYALLSLGVLFFLPFILHYRKKRQEVSSSQDPASFVNGVELSAMH